MIHYPLSFSLKAFMSDSVDKVVGGGAKILNEKADNE